MGSKYQQGLDRNPANYSSLTPLSFLRRSAHVFPDKVAVIDGDVSLTYADFHARCRALANALVEQGVQRGDTVSVLCFNTLELLECHYAIPMAGAVLNALNTRLDAATLRFILEHGEARLLLYDTEFEEMVGDAVSGIAAAPALVSISRPSGPSQGLAKLDYEQLVAAGDPAWPGRPVENEWDAIALNYTSGTTGNPKGVVYHHRGAYLSAMTNAIAMEMTADTVYLWTLPMFHCNGWCYTWAVTAIGGTHVCLRKVQPQTVLDRIRICGVTHMCGAPIVLNMLLNDFHKNGVSLPSSVQFALGGAAPPSAVIRRGRELGFDITHLYGLTETYGPSMLCVRQPEWRSLPLEELAPKMARQGVGLHAIDEVAVAGSGPNGFAPWDGQTMGELLMRGNNLMKGYLKNPDATREAFKDGWFHTGDLAVMHPDGYAEVKDRAKDIIISGGENISSQEVEDVLYRHPAVLEAAVVAMPDEKWGESPCAFVSLREDSSATDEQSLIAWCRDKLPHYKAPTRVVFGELPKTSTGKIRKNVLRDQLRMK
ncbi:acyl-CoA synthetase [Allopusillimonas soli]|uniref:AMP-binding protein n=1 Tax=Allopusillimonas soli TaxID=659016 RepID=A0A853FH39_9BURK|nr:AMP-binding protein [Allopusillimonas soli]NYT39048.1 AMP-binding protein [Allopusillimonas soli]TEA69594.1 acyl-CoA synthetase [Allopusillimonas soli]